MKTIEEIKQELNRELSICDEWLEGGGHLLLELREKRKLARALLTAIDGLEKIQDLPTSFTEDNEPIYMPSTEFLFAYKALQTIREQWGE